MQAASVGTAVILILLLVYLAIFLFAIANYIITSLALHRIGDRRGIQNSWLVWLPIANYWIIGSIVDDYDNRCGIKRSWRKVMLSLSIVGIGGFIFSYIAAIVMIIGLGLQGEVVPQEAFGALVIIYLLLLAAILGLSAFNVLNTICTYKIFESTRPEKAIKYMLISLLVPLGNAICLYLCKESGYSKPVPQPNFPYYSVPQNNPVNTEDN